MPFSLQFFDNNPVLRETFEQKSQHERPCEINIFNLQRFLTPMDLHRNLLKLIEVREKESIVEKMELSLLRLLTSPPTSLSSTRPSRCLQTRAL